jgi:hypothetical protein
VLRHLFYHYALCPLQDLVQIKNNLTALKFEGSLPVVVIGLKPSPWNDEARVLASLLQNILQILK